MNWGNRILLVFIVFAGMISYMVYRCMKLPVELVSDEYYKDELAYQRVIDGTERANALSAPVTITIAPAGLVLRMPAEMRRRQLKGKIVFFCPADPSRDRILPLEPDVAGSQQIGAGTVRKGMYNVKIGWETGGANYFSEQALNYQ
ncbi:MAG TPA: FixH family protein [Puia sp.]|nr:FixH family protein [Puia sp.]